MAKSPFRELAAFDACRRMWQSAQPPLALPKGPSQSRQRPSSRVGNLQDTEVRFAEGSSVRHVEKLLEKFRWALSRKAD